MVAFGEDGWIDPVLLIFEGNGDAFPLPFTPETKRKAVWAVQEVLRLYPKRIVAVGYAMEAWALKMEHPGASKAELQEAVDAYNKTGLADAPGRFETVQVGISTPTEKLGSFAIIETKDGQRTLGPWESFDGMTGRFADFWEAN